MRQAFVARLHELAEADPRVMLVTGDLGYGMLNGYRERFPHQYINVGVAEQNMIGISVGLALEGRVVFAYSIGSFPTLRCLEQIRNDACCHAANVKVVAMGGGFSYGALGTSHHATEDLAVMRALPGVTVVAPCDAWEAGEATAAIAAHPGPCYLRLDRSAGAAALEPGAQFELGRARRVREGADITLICTGGIAREASAAADCLAAEGVACRLLHLHTLRPLDTEAVEAAARETGGIVTVEEHTVSGGLGGLVAETCLEAGAPPRVFRRVGMRDGFARTAGSQDYLRAAHGMDAASIAAAVRAALGGGRGG